VKFTYLCCFLGVALAILASLVSEYTVFYFTHSATYFNHSLEQAALTLVAFIFLVKGFVGLLDSTNIPSETYQGENFFPDADPDAKSGFYHEQGYYLDQETFDIDVGVFKTTCNIQMVPNREILLA